MRIGMKRIGMPVIARTAAGASSAARACVAICRWEGETHEVVV